MKIRRDIRDQTLSQKQIVTYIPILGHFILMISNLLTFPCVVTSGVTVYVPLSLTSVAKFAGRIRAAATTDTPIRLAYRYVDSA